GGARRAGRLLRPSGAVSILATLSKGCARFARSTRGNQPPPLRGVPIRAHQPFTRVASSPLTGLQRPGGAQDCCHGWSGAGGGAQPVEGAADSLAAPEGRRDVATGGAEPKAQRNPWESGALDCPPRRGGGNARSARRIGGARRAGRLL